MVSHMRYVSPGGIALCAGAAWSARSAAIGRRKAPGLGRCALFPGFKNKRASEELRPTALLVDGFSTGVDDAKEAISVLRQQCSVVSIALFAEPGRLNSQKWRTFCQESGTVFRAVARTTGFKHDPTEDAIRQEALPLASSPVHAIAILTADSGFAPLASDLKSRGKDVFFILPNGNSIGAVHRFERCPARLLVLRSPKREYRVHVKLLSDGAGACKFLPAPCASPPIPQEDMIRLDQYFQSIGYPAGDGPYNVSVPRIAKFWFTNQLGSLVVHPRRLACSAMLAELQAGRLSHACAGAKDIAFVLPGFPKNSQRYGPPPTDAIVEGGGPFMLQMTQGFHETLMQKMGYLDDNLNADLDEALWVFSQRSRNKMLLKKTQSLDTDGLPSVAGLREALLSEQLDGIWHIPPRDKDVRRFLVENAALQSSVASQAEILEAMRMYARSIGLPPRTTYNGYVWQLLKHCVHAKKPMRRS